MPGLGQFEGEVSVLVTDVQMRGSMDGLGLAAQPSTAHPGLPVVAMSRSPGAVEAAAALTHVAAALAKPFASDVLAQVVLAAARWARPQAPGVPTVEALPAAAAAEAARMDAARRAEAAALRATIDRLVTRL